MPKLKHYCFFLFLILPTLFIPYSTFAFSEEELIISAVGDIMLGTTYPELMFPKEDEKVSNLNFLNVFEGSHIIFGNLEGPICSKGKTNKCPNWGQKCFAFKMPISSAEELRKAGFNVLSIANNHIFDFGRSCAEETISSLQAQNIKPVGGKYVAEFEVGRKKIAVLGFSYLLSDLSFSILDIEKAKKIISSYKRNYDLVIVSFHGGSEGAKAMRLCFCEEKFLDEKRGDVVRFARAMVEAGADLILGHGPHVLRGMELYKGKLIVYSLGNFYTFGVFNTKYPNSITLVLKVWLSLKDGTFIKGFIFPLKQNKLGIPYPDEKNTALYLIKSLSQEDLSCKLNFLNSSYYFTLQCPER